MLCLVRKENTNESNFTTPLDVNNWPCNTGWCKGLYLLQEKMIGRVKIMPQYNKEPPPSFMEVVVAILMAAFIGVLVARYLFN